MSELSIYGDWSKEELIAQIARLESRKQHGLVWEEDQAEGESDAGSHPQPVLTEVSQHSIRGASNLTHVLIEGDNLHALSALSETHTQAVDLIYIDPPYNRGMRDGNDSRYNDQYVNRDHLFRHSKWLSFMAKRLTLARQLLKESGVIFVSIDDNELAHLKILMDEIFGEENYKNTIIIKRGAKNVQAQFESIDKLYSGYEYVLFYTMNPAQRFPKMVKDLSEAKPGGWNNHWRGTNRPTMRYELFGITPESGQWRWGKERSLAAVENYALLLKEMGKTSQELSSQELDAWFLSKLTETGVEVDLLRLSANGKPEHYVPPTDTTLLNDVWFDLAPNSTSVLKSIFGKKVFDNPKPLELIKRICKFADKDALIVDFFAGSGTTGHAILELNKQDGGTRQFILATSNENNICSEVCYPRLQKVIEGYENAKGMQVQGLGGNLKYYRAEIESA